MLQGPLQVVDHRQPRSGCSGTFLLSRPDQIFGASLAEVVQLGSGTPPVVFELGNSCFGFLEHIGLRLGTVALRNLLLLWLGTIALSGLLLGLDTVALGGLLLGHGDQRAVNSASITSSESSPDSPVEVSAEPAEAPAVAPARAEAARDWRSWCISPVRARSRSMSACSSSAVRASLSSSSARARSCSGIAPALSSSVRRTW